MGDRDVKRETLLFDRPDELAAVRPAEAEGRERDEGRLLVSTSAAHRHAREPAENARAGASLTPSVAKGP